ENQSCSVESPPSSSFILLLHSLLLCRPSLCLRRRGAAVENQSCSRQKCWFLLPSPSSLVSCSAVHPPPSRSSAVHR
ncbi:hypothetical protein A2U01_0089277, partial [Trifolium medium]|nr:hypothetical protein [Trifolium medium]